MYLGVCMYACMHVCMHLFHRSFVRSFVRISRTTLKTFFFPWLESALGFSPALSTPFVLHDCTCRTPSSNDDGFPPLQQNWYPTTNSQKLHQDYTEEYSMKTEYITTPFFIEKRSYFLQSIHNTNKQGIG